ncbi:hypothetical protein MRX96_032185 [Rhipicephalus microplus]
MAARMHAVGSVACLMGHLSAAHLDILCARPPPVSPKRRACCTHAETHIPRRTHCFHALRKHRSRCTSADNSPVQPVLQCVPSPRAAITRAAAEPRRNPRQTGLLPTEDARKPRTAFSPRHTARNRQWRKGADTILPAICIVPSATSAFILIKPCEGKKSEQYRKRKRCRGRAT